MVRRESWPRRSHRACSPTGPRRRRRPTTIAAPVPTASATPWCYNRISEKTTPTNRSIRPGSSAARNASSGTPVSTACRSTCGSATRARRRRARWRSSATAVDFRTLPELYRHIDCATIDIRRVAYRRWLVCDDDGKRKKLPLNPAATVIYNKGRLPPCDWDLVVGTVLIAEFHEVE